MSAPLGRTMCPLRSSACARTPCRGRPTPPPAQLFSPSLPSPASVTRVAKPAVSSTATSSAGRAAAQPPSVACSVVAPEASTCSASIAQTSGREPCG
eukprot:1745837-Prymnesium_polylepis.2